MGRPAAELERVIGNPLPAWRLAELWKQLPERERFGFLLSLDESIVDEVIVLTMPAQWLAEKERTDHERL